MPPGPAGAPARGRLDVLPTGRNLYAIDPRSAPTRNAWEIGRRAAEEILKRYAQDHGEWPKRIVLDLWGSATMRTGGDDLAQAFALIGCRPTWDAASTRVSGFEVLPLAMLGRPRVDVTLRISGLFRDVFPSQIALFAAAVRAVAALEESADDNPLAGLQGEAWREYSARRPAPMASGLARALREATGRSGPSWRRLISPRPATPMTARAKRAKRRRSFERGSPAPRPLFTRRTCRARTRSTPTPSPSMKAASPPRRRKWERIRRSIISTRPSPARRRSARLGQEIARALRGRAANPRWISGQMRHGHRGAAEIAQSLDNLYCFAALTDAVESAQFDLMFDATLGDDSVRAFLVGANRQAACHMAGVFEEAARRGFWLSRRNSSQRILASVLEEAA